MEKNSAKIQRVWIYGMYYKISNSILETSKDGQSTNDSILMKPKVQFLDIKLCFVCLQQMINQTNVTKCNPVMTRLLNPNTTQI